MARDISLPSWTGQSIRKAKDIINRTDETRKYFQAGGGKIIDIL